MDENQDANLISFLNIGEKGADNVVIQFGSHSIKLGLASQMQPFMVPTAIAYPTRVKSDEESKDNYTCLFDPDAMEEDLEEDDKVQARFDAWSQPVLKQVIGDLRERKAYLIDEKAAEAIKKGNLGYKALDDDKKCVQSFADTQKICYSDLSKNPFGSELHLEIHPDKFQMITNPEAYMREQGRNYLYGSEVSAIHASCNLKVRRPIANGDLNISPSYTAAECV